jgi:hypothetical protein
VPGARPEGPELLTGLTLIQGDQLVRSDRFERVRRAQLNPGTIGFQLTMPLSTLPGGEGPVFVTSACVPDHATTMRTWQATGDGLSRASAAEESSLMPYLKTTLTTADLATLGLSPRVVGTLPTSIPGCARLGVLGTSGSPYTETLLAGLVCFHEGAVVRTVRAPVVGYPLLEVAALDIDGDGVDELIVLRREVVLGDSLPHGSVIWYDAAGDRFVEIDIGTIFY